MKDFDFLPLDSDSPRKHRYGRTPVIKAPEKIQMLSLVDKIVKAAERSGLSKSFFEYVKPYLDLFCTRQKLSKEEGIILAIIVNNAIDGGTDCRDIVRFLNCDNIKMLKLMPVFNELVGKRLIVVAHEFGNNIDYMPVDNLLRAYCDNKPYFPPSLHYDTDEDFLTSVFDLSFALFQHNMTRKNYDAQSRVLLEENMNLSIMRRLKSYKLQNGKYNIAVLYLCCRLYFDNERVQELSDFAFIFEEGNERNHFVHEMKKGKGILFDKEIIEFGVTKDGLVDTLTYRLTDDAVHNLLPDYKPKAAKGMRMGNIMQPENISEKKLFYSEDVQEQVDRLTDLLGDKNFRAIQQRLAENNLRKGFCCLFYGGPGTGKTAMALELARRTGRKVIRIDLSTVRNMYVGQSEKNVQAIFSTYKEMLKTESMAPILLLNEADGLLTKRNTMGIEGVDKMENTMQNILLQNMEDFEGIMIATTNLAVNLDKAFERRFLYKIRFTKPDTAIRKKIWHSMLPSLNSAMIEELACSYDFSGGQIENITRKVLVDSILYGKGKATSMESVEGYCRHELIGRTETLKQIGFNAYAV